jgi:hypothetical protein
MTGSECIAGVSIVTVPCALDKITSLFDFQVEVHSIGIHTGLLERFET